MNYQEWCDGYAKICKYPCVTDQGSARCTHPFFKGAFAWCDMMNCPELMEVKK